MRIFLTYYYICGGGHIPVVTDIVNYVNSELWREKFSSFFNELRIELWFRSDFKSFSITCKEEFDEKIKCLPILRIYRKHNRIEAKLIAPEVSERIQNEYSSNYMAEKFERSIIPKRYKNISDVDLSRMIIDRCLEAGQLIARRIKSRDDFDSARFEQILLRVKSSISEEFLKHVKNPIAIWQKQDYIESVLRTREYRKAINRKKNRLIHVFRVLVNGIPEDALSPYKNEYEKIFRDLLRSKRLMCPRWNSIYIILAANEEDALMYSSIDPILCDGISIIDYDKYKCLSEKEKGKAVFDFICEGLRDIAELDKLDSIIIDEAIREIEAITINNAISLKNK